MGKRARKRIGQSPASSSSQVLPPRRTVGVAGATATVVPTARTRTGQRIEGRPRPPWHPVPVTEVALTAGLVLAGVGFLRGPDKGAVIIGVGILLATVAVMELCAREHFSGFKSHTLLLAFLPVVIVHTVMRLYVTESYEGPAAVLGDMALFAVLNLMLLDRFRRASRKRKAAAPASGGGRR